MKKLLTLLSLAILMIGTNGIANAQFRQSIFLNGNIPTGDFNSKANSNTVPLTYTEVGKDAAVGFGLGYRISYRFDVGVGEVAPFLNGDFMWNTIGGGWSDKYSDAYLNSPTYFNIPILAGVSYIYDELPWGDISAFGEFGVGTDLFWITSEGSKDLRYAYKSTFSFSWMLGAGAYFGRHVSAGIYYYDMGKHNIDYTQKTLDNNIIAKGQVIANEAMGMGRQRRSVGSFMLRIGFHF